MDKGKKKDVNLDGYRGLSATQLHEIKEEINRELVRDLKVIQKQLYQDLYQDLLEELRSSLKLQLPAVSKMKDEIKRDIITEVKADVNTLLVESNSRQLTMTKQVTKDVVQAVTKHMGKEISKNVHNSVIKEINETLVPRVDNMVQWVNYNMLDGGEIITDYRRALNNQVNTSNLLAITGSGSKEEKFTQFLRNHLFFNDLD